MSEVTDVIDKLLEKHGELSESMKKGSREVLIKMFEEGQTPLEATGIDKDLIEAIYSMAYFYYNAGQIDNALKFNQMLFTLDPSDKRFSLGVAAAQQQLGNYQDALNHFLIYSKLDQESPIPFFHMTDCFLKMNQPIGALIMLQIMLSKAEKDPKTYSQLIERGKLQYDQLLKETGVNLSGSRNMTVMEQVLNPPKKKPKT